MIRIGSFSKYQGKKGVAVCRIVPRNFVGETYSELAPTQQIFEWYNKSAKDDKAKDIYRRLFYRDVLSKLDPSAVHKQLEGKVLLCYEDEKSFSHLQIVKMWLNENGYECKGMSDISEEQKKYLTYGRLYELLGEDLVIEEDWFRRAYAGGEAGYTYWKKFFLMKTLS